MSDEQVIEQKEQSVEENNSAGVGEVENTEPAKQEKKERVYTKDDVSKIANAERNRAYDQALKDFQAKQAQQTTQQQNAYQPTDFDSQFDAAVQRRLEAERQREEAARQKEFEKKLGDEVSGFIGKLDGAFDASSKAIKFKDQETSEHFSNLNLHQINPLYVPILNSVDNPKEVLKEFAQYPEKLTTILNTADKFGVENGIKAIKRLSESIKLNQDAASVQLPNPPLSQVKNSTTGLDNGKNTASDYRTMYRNRY